MTAAVVVVLAEAHKDRTDFHRAIMDYTGI